MKIIAVLFSILLLIITIQYVRYRRQIKSICRQMSFMEMKETNKMIHISRQKNDMRRLLVEKSAV